MKIKDVLSESTALAGRYWDFPDAQEFQNGEVNEIAEINKQYYKEFFKEFYENGTPPVFEKDVNDVPSMCNIPEDENYSSSGRKGEIMLKKLAGLPTNDR